MNLQFVTVARKGDYIHQTLESLDKTKGKQPPFSSARFLVGSPEIDFLKTPLVSKMGLVIPLLESEWNFIKEKSIKNGSVEKRQLVLGWALKIKEIRAT